MAEYYQTKSDEFLKEINDIEQSLENDDFDSLLNDLKNASSVLFKHHLAITYQSIRDVEFSKASYKKDFDRFVKRFPVVLSTTDSIINNKEQNGLFDYIIVDEASQVNLLTGFLTMACTKNIIVVGDLKQLPHIADDSLDRSIDTHFNIAPAYSYFDKSLLEQHTSMLKSLFSLNNSSLITNFQILQNDDLSDLKKIRLRLENLSEIVAIKPLGLKYNNKVHYFENLEMIVLPNSPGQKKKYTYLDTGLDFKNFFNGRTVEFENLYLIFSSTEDQQKELFSKIQPRFFRLDEKKVNQDIKETFDNNELSFKENSIKLDNDLIIPKNKKFIVNPGQEIILDNASIISYGTLIFNGTKKNPIKIYSPKNNKSGIVILNSEEENKFKFVKFENLSSKISDDYLTGAITVYKSKVLFQNCIFDKNHSEDFLNLISSKFIIKKTQFKNSKFDMLDSDFSSGEIIDSSFFHSGNDAVDFSGSDVILKNLTINNTGDKAISIGENSILTIEDVKIDQSISGIAIKDESTAKITNSSIYNTKNGLSSYIKKKNYKNSEINLNNVIFRDNLYDIVNSDFSKIYLNEELLNHNVKNIKN